MTHRRVFLTITAVLLTVVLSLLALVQFAAAAPALRTTMTPSATPTEIAPIENLESAERAWEALGADEYWITVIYGSAWDGMELTLRVRGDAVMELRATCQPAPLGGCFLQRIDPREYTVPGLLAQARELLERDDAEWARVTFDNEAPFITHLSYDHPEIYDEQWFLRVTSFSSQSPAVSATATAISHQMTATAEAVMITATASP